MKKLILFVSLILFTNLYSQNDVDLSSINELYYNINDYGFKGFSAEVKYGLFDNFKKSIENEKYLSIVNKISFKLDFFSKDSVIFTIVNLDTTGNTQVDQGLKKITSGLEQVVKGFFQTWTELTFSPLFDLKKYNYKVNTDSNVTSVQYQQDNAEITNYLTSTRLDSVHFKNPSSKFAMYPVYELTEFNKLIIKSLLTTFNNNVELRMSIIYKDFGKIKIPQVVTGSQKIPGVTYELKFLLHNIELK